MRKLAMLVMILIFALYILPSSLLAVNSISILKVEITPPVINENCSFKALIKLGISLSKGERIYIKFPREFVLPISIDSKYVEIGIEKNNPSEVLINERVISIVLSSNLSKFDDLDGTGIPILINYGAGIKNPAESGIYEFYIWTDEEQLPVSIGASIGEEGEIDGSQVESLEASLSNDFAGKKSSYFIKFRNTSSSFLSFDNGDYIDILFPRECILPQTVKNTAILVNLGTASKAEIIKNKLRIYLPDSWIISFGAQCQIEIREEFGIINPEFAGNYLMQVATSKDRKYSIANYSINSTSVSLYYLNLDPNNQGFNSSLTLEFKTSDSGKLTAGKDKIALKFSPEFFIPEIITPGSIEITVENRTYKPLSVTVSKSVLTVITPITIPERTYVKIFIGFDAGILNPELLGRYNISLATSEDASFVEYFVEIYHSKVSLVSVSLSNDGASQSSDIYISFKIGAGGELESLIDEISIFFPQEFVIPTSIKSQYVLVNSTPSAGITVSKNTISIIVPDDLQAYATVKIDILSNAGIINPSTAKEYFVYVNTSKELEIVASAKFVIKSIPFTKVEISPEKPDGLNNFYKTKPLVKFTSSSAIDPNPVIYYYFDNNQPVVYSGSSVVAPEGTHTLYYYAVDKEAHKEEIRSVQIKVDTIPPQIVVISPQDNSVLNSKMLVVKGVVDVNSTVKVNGNEATVDSLGNFEASVEVLSSPQIFNISATDLAGNSSQKVLTVYLDTAPPNLTIVKPVMFQQVSKLPLIVEGITEKGAKVNVNGDNASVNEDGTFSYSLSTLQEGDISNIEVIATDVAGNSTKRSVSVKYLKSVTIILQVNNAFALINGQTYTLEAAPVITSSRTMVPLRFIGEAFGAQFEYEPVTKTIDITFGSDRIRMQIGKKTAIVNDKEVVLDVVPYIVNGRTLVPIRFISETFGAEVVWNGSTKTVTIIYPKP